MSYRYHGEVFVEASEGFHDPKLLGSPFDYNLLTQVVVCLQEKSKLDWNEFKQNEGIEEELTIHNRGKDGYVEQQAFLNRADQRQFELERAMRLRLSNKR